MRRAAALCLLCVALGGCGAASRDSAKDFKGDERAVATAVEAMETASRKGDEQRICTRLFARPLLEALGKQGTKCTTAVKEALEDTDAFDLKVDDVTITGERAIAKVTSGTSSTGRKSDTLGLQREGGAWKITSLSGAAG